MNNFIDRLKARLYRLDKELDALNSLRKAIYGKYYYLSERQRCNLLWALLKIQETELDKHQAAVDQIYLDGM